MKFKLATILAVLLLVLVAVPAVAAPKINVEGGLWYGWIQGAFDDAGQAWIDGDDSYNEIPIVYPGAVIPYLHASIDVTPSLKIGLDAWFAHQRGANKPVALTTYDDYVMWDYEWFSAGDYVLHAAGETTWATTRLGVECGPLGDATTSITLLGGIQGTMINEAATVAVYDNADEIDYLRTFSDSYMAGPFVGLAGQHKLGKGFTFYGDVTGALMWGVNSVEAWMGWDADDLNERSESYYASSSGLHPAVEGTLGVKYDINSSLFAGLAIHGAAVFGIVQPADYTTPCCSYHFVPGDTGALSMAGLQLTMGYKF